MSIKKVTIIGGGGRLGPSILNALLSAPEFEVSVISRKSSKATYPADKVNDVRVSDDMTHDELVSALKTQDALIICIAGTLSGPAIKFANAAYEAGVKRVVPADFGSCDSADERSLKLLLLYREKEKVRKHLQKLSLATGPSPTGRPRPQESGEFSWTSLITGHFLDYGLECGLMQIDVKLKKARIFDDGEYKWSATILPDIGLATVRILQKPEQTRNQLLYVQSVLATQNQLLESVEKVVGPGFDVQHLKSDDFIKEHLAKVENNPEDADAIEELVSVEGIVNANWEKRETFANELLGMPERNLDDIVREVFQK